MRAVPKMDPRKTTAERTLPRVRPQVAGAAKQQQLPRVQAAPSRGLARASHEKAIALLLADARATGEGTRIIGFAATRKGKTAFTRKLVAAMLSDGIAERAIVHDVKYPDRQQYDGFPTYSVRSMANLLQENEIFVAREEDAVAAEICANVARTAVGVGIKTVVVLDEGAFALARNDEGEPIERRWAGPDLAWLQLQGGAAGASTVSLWQMLRQAPGSAVDSASAFFVGNLGGRSLAYAKDYRIIPPEALDTITTLAPGEICLFFADREWDRTIYYSPEERR